MSYLISLCICLPYFGDFHSILSHTLIAFQIVHNLARALDTDASLAILEERSRHVQINDESLCDSCHARLGTKLFAMYPDDTIVCYKVGNVDLYLFYDFYCFWNLTKSLVRHS